VWMTDFELVVCSFVLGFGELDSEKQMS